MFNRVRRVGAFPRNALSCLALSFLTGSALLLGNNVAQGQSRPAGTAVLSELPKQEIQERYDGTSEDVSVGYEIFQAFSKIGHYHNYIRKNKPAKIVFRLAGSNQPSQYESLSLSFGVADTNKRAQRGGVTRLSVYRDGEFHGYRDVGLGDKAFWEIDVTGVRSLAFEASCVRSVDSNDRCPNIFFFEELLEK